MTAEKLVVQVILMPYTAGRLTTDVDAEFGGRVHLPDDLAVEVTLEDGTRHAAHLDTNYNSIFALMHEDYLADSIPLDLGVDPLRVHVPSPVARTSQRWFVSGWQAPTRSKHAQRARWPDTSAEKRCCA